MMDMREAALIQEASHRFTMLRHCRFYFWIDPPGVQGTEFFEGYADVLKSESCAKLLKCTYNF